MREKGNVQMLKEDTLAFEKKGSISVVSGKKSLPLAQAIRSRAKEVRTIVLEGRRVCFGFLSFHRLLPSLPTCIDTV
jgi:hypothetical protein